MGLFTVHAAGMAVSTREQRTFNSSPAVTNLQTVKMFVEVVLTHVALKQWQMQTKRAASR